MSDLTGRTNEELAVALMHRGLRVNDPELNALAAELLGRLGTHPVRRLVLAAARRGNPAGYRLRALAVLRRIGEPSGPDDLLALTAAGREPKPEIRRAAEDVLAAWGCSLHELPAAVAGVRPRDPRPTPPRTR